MMHSHTYIYDKAVTFIFTQLEPSQIISAKKVQYFCYTLILYQSMFSQIWNSKSLTS